MHWEASHAAGPADPGWHADPLDAERLRWWDGSVWTARVARLDPGSDAISWHADIAALPAPEPAAEPPLVPALPVEVAPTPRLVAVPTMADAFDETDEEAESDGPDGPALVGAAAASGAPNTRRAWATLAAAIMLLLVGAGVGTAMLGDDQRPTLDPRRVYTDDAADFTLRYPEQWRVEEPTGACPRTLPEDGCIRVVFEIGPDVSAEDANTLQVRSFNTDADLDALHEWVTTETAIVVEQIPTIRLVAASEARLAGAPAFVAQLADERTPTTRLVVYEGRTTSGRALVVTLTVRDPRTAPTDEEFEKVLASISSS